MNNQHVENKSNTFQKQLIELLNELFKIRVRIGTVVLKSLGAMGSGFCYARWVVPVPARCPSTSHHSA